MNAEEKTHDASFVRHLQGLSTDDEVFRIIKEKPGLSIYQLAKLLGSSIGKVDASVSRMKERNEVEVSFSLKENRLTKGVFPFKSSSLPKPQLTVELGALNDPEKWKGKLFLCGLDRSTIGISPYEISDWLSRALIIEKITPALDDNNLVIDLPSKLSDFYSWFNSETQLAVMEDRVLVIFKSNVPIAVKNENQVEELEANLISIMPRHQLVFSAPCVYGRSSGLTTLGAVGTTHGYGPSTTEENRSQAFSYETGMVSGNSAMVYFTTKDRPERQEGVSIASMTSITTGTK